MLCILLTLLSFAQPPAEPRAPKEPMEPQATIIVEAHRDFEVYVATIIIENFTDDIEAVIGAESVYGYTSTYSHLAQIDNGAGGFEPIGIKYDDFKVYNEKTISYAWENCNYKRDPKKCAYQNNHFLLETTITIDSNQLVVSMFLYDSGLQLVSQSTVTSTKIVRWIRQQQIYMQQQNSASRSQGAPNCNSSTGNCPPVSGQGYNQQTTTIQQQHEKLPLQWEIPHRLLNKHVAQATILLWTGARIE